MRRTGPMIILDYVYLFHNSGMSCSVFITSQDFAVGRFLQITVHMN